MIGRIDLDRLRPEQKADLIYTQARTELSGRLWRAALGDGASSDGPQQAMSSGPLGGNLDALLAVLSREDGAAVPTPRRPELPQAMTTVAPAVRAAPAAAAPAAEPRAAISAEVGRASGLGPNTHHQASLERAAQRTGIPTAALAAIVDAEAAKGRDGSWKLYSRNPRSSAAGLGQFLAGTWIGEAERPGTWLNQVARNRGWLTDSGRVEKGARSELLALRYDGDTSIHATADYAKGNLDRLRNAGVEIGSGVERIAQAAYLGHHLGAGDAIKFMKGGIDDRRAAVLLKAQVGSANANMRLAQTGDASAAHRQWLLGFVERHIRPDRFMA